MANNKIWFKTTDLTYESFKLIMYQVSSNLVLSKLFNYKNNIDYALKNDIDIKDNNTLFNNVNKLHYKLNLSVNNKHYLMSSILNEVFVIPDLEALMFKEPVDFFIEKTINQNQETYLESIDLQSLTSYIFISFYETNKHKILNKIGFSHFVDKKTTTIHNKIWGLAKTIRDNLAHDLSFTDSSGSSIFKILKTHNIDFFGKTIPISCFEFKKVNEVFSSIDLILFMHLMEKEL